MGVARPECLFGHVQSPRGEFASGTFAHAFDVQRCQGQACQEELDECREGVFLVVDFADFGGAFGFGGGGVKIVIVHHDDGVDICIERERARKKETVSERVGGGWDQSKRALFFGIVMELIIVI